MSREKIVKKYGTSYVIVLNKEDRKILGIDVNSIVEITKKEDERTNENPDDLDEY